jgi:hypothetical protein
LIARRRLWAIDAPLPRANSKDHSVIDDDIGGKPNQADRAP